MISLKRNRLKNEDIKKVVSLGKSVSGNFLSVKFIRNNIGRLRFTIIVSNKISGKSVERNLLRRRIREIIRQSGKYNETNFDLVILTTGNILNKSREEIKRVLEATINKILSQ